MFNRQIFRTYRIVAATIGAGLLAASCGDGKKSAPSASDQLPSLGVQLDQTTVSGISSGAYMAGQFEFAHAKIVTGAAIIAGGPYGCSESIFADSIPGPGSSFFNLTKAINGCMLNLLAVWGAGDPRDLAAKAARRAERGEIDPISAVASDKVYLFSGKSDRTVVPQIVAAAAEFYKGIGVPPANIKYVTDIDAGHAFVTQDQGKACGKSGEPYVVDCDYDQAGALLDFFYGPLKSRASQPTGMFFEFDQKPFTREFAMHGLADKGVAYIPTACRDAAGCRVHIAFHGCAQTRTQVGDAFIRTTGFAEWADANRLIVLFPQVAITAVNPQGCWDWWGYTGHDYLMRSAPQITAVMHMLTTLASAPGS